MSKLISTNLEWFDDKSLFSLKVKNEKSWLESAFEIYRMIYHRQNAQKSSLKKQKILLFIENFIWFLYVASFLWIPNLAISDWEENKNIWKIIGYARLDNLCSEYEVINLCILASLGIIMANIFGFFSIIIFIYLSKRLPVIVFDYFWINCKVLYKFLSLPIFTLLFICLKYNWFKNDDIWEYFKKNEISSFEVGNYTQFFIFLGLVYLFFFNIANSICSSKICHSLTHIRLDSKAHSKIDIYSAILIFFVPLLFEALGSEYIIFFQTVLMIISGILVMLTISELPYFSVFMNSLATIKFLGVSLLSALFIFAKIIDTSIVIWLFMFTIIPCIAGLTIRKVKISNQRIISKIPRDLQSIKNAYYLEHNLRSYLCSKNIEENKNPILYFLGRCFNDTNLYSNKLLAIWEVNYCIFTLNDYGLAKIKLWKAKYSSHSLEGDFQEYICIKNVSEFEGHESIQFMNYFQQIGENRMEDAILCVKLLDFWKEIVSVNPNAKKINKMLEVISSSIANILENYSNLHQKFPKSKEALSYYLTYMKDIMFDFDKSNLLSSKLQSIDKLSIKQNADSKDLSFFDENNGLMLISFENKNFGKIAYANQKASEILKYPIIEITGHNFSFFIPPPYDSYFNCKLFHLLQFATEVEIKTPNHFFLSLPSKFIIDCIGKASLISLSNQIYILFIFQEIKHSSGFAMISPDKEISWHSENFSKFIGKMAQNFEGLSFNHLFPSLQNVELQDFKPYKLTETEINLTPCYFEFYGLKINYILIADDSSETNVSKSNENIQNSQSNLEDPSKYQLSCDVTNQGQKGKFVKYFNTESQQRFSLNSESSSHLGNLKKIVNLSSHSIKIFHIVFILSMLIVMTLNSIVLIYTSNAIVAESNTDLLILLGKVEKSVQGIAHNARGVGVLAGSSQELVDYSYNQIISYMKVLEETHQNITNNLNEWNTCGGNDAFTNENAPIWENFDGIYIKEANLIDAVSQFINVVTDIQGNIFLDKYNNKQNDAKEVKFINLNGLSQIFNYCNSSLYTFTDCIMNNSKELESWMNILLVVGFANLVICLVITMFFARYSIIAENNLWNKIKKNASKNYEHLKKNYFDRLSEMHGQNNILFSDTKKISEIGNFKNHWKYFWRNSVYFILALAFFLVNYLYLYQNCVEYLHLRPSLLRTIINSQVLYKSLIVWTSEFSISTTPIALPIYLSGVYPFSNELSCLNNVISSLLNSEREIRNKKYSPLLSDKFSEVFYENTRNIAKIGDYGVYTAGALLPFEAYYLDFSGLDNYLEVWFKLVKEINALDSEYDLLVDLADKDSQNAIMQQLRWIAITLGIFIVCSWILYFVFYLPFLLKEQKKLENMTLIAKLIPNKYFK